MEFFATCPRGFEHLLQDELSSLGVKGARALKGQVGFEGGLADAYRACLWSRLASRIMLVLARGGSRDADELYETVSQVDWTEHLGPASSFAINAHGTNAELRNTQFIALRAKDAITDQMLARTGVRPRTEPSHPDVEVDVRVSRERATISLNLSGAPLFRRGYEGARGPHDGLAPLRADYAAALLEAGGWYRSCRNAARDGSAPMLICLFPGAGTVLVEAAEQALDRAPGLTRARWGFEGWQGHDPAAWEELVDEAHERARQAKGRGVSLLGVSGLHADIPSATRLLRSAGMPEVRPESIAADAIPARLKKAASATKGGSAPLAICDLSWIDVDDAAAEASALPRLASLSDALTTGALVTLGAGMPVDDVIGSEPTSTIATVVGRDAATIRTYDASAASVERPHATITDAQGAQHDIPVFERSSDQFAARLRKVWRERRKWARREDIGCYRIYDSDLPDYAVSIDLFEGSELMPRHDGKRGRWLQVYEYQAPKEIDEGRARRRLLDVLAIAPLTLGVAPENVFVRVRSRGRGGAQYAAETREGALDPGRRGSRRPHREDYAPLPPGAHLVDEGGLTFEVNFSARLDCGLFLDHRDTRALVREMMKETKGSKRFLNLFAYTGTATCYAADGGAKHTTTVDMSAPSLAWARRNMIRNGFDSPAAEYVRADVIDWVATQRHTANRWDLVFCDVPTFSNSKGMRHGSWDVQRDHAELLIGVSRLLTHDGRCIFSCNLRSFKPDVNALAKAGVEIEDITAQTIPEDFKRNPKIHHCYIVRRTARK